MMIESVLVVHSSRDEARRLRDAIMAAELDVTVLTGLPGVPERVASALYDVLFLEAALLDRPGMRTAMDILNLAPDMPMVLVAPADDATAFALMARLSAVDLLRSPVAPEPAARLLKRLDENVRLIDENRYLWNELARVYGYDELIGTDPSMTEVLRQCSRVSGTDAAVLILGEPGTEKELVAQFIHRSSHRGDRPFIRMNGSGISPQQCARELFGWEDASGRHPGRVELAAGGTLHIEEVDALPTDVQARLLALLEDSHYQREGGHRCLESEVRVIASTSADPYEKIETGEFREDLFFRLNVVPIFLPPLRQRPGAIRPLANQIAHRLGVSGGAEELIGPGQWPRMQAYTWPGNTSELEGELKLAVLRAARSGEDLPTWNQPWEDDDEPD